MKDRRGSATGESKNQIGACEHKDYIRPHHLQNFPTCDLITPDPLERDHSNPQLAGKPVWLTITGELDHQAPQKFC